MEKMVSVIMPVYNVEAYITRAIESVLKQTYSDFELLIVNDGSPDNSIQIAEGYAHKDNRVKIINKVNGGLSDARNVGMQHAKGEYIYFLDSDDYIEENLLEITIAKMKKENLDVVLFGYYTDYVDDKENIKTRNTVIMKESKYTEECSNILELSQELLLILGYAWNKVYRKDIIDKNNATFVKGISLIEDILFNEIILSKAKNIAIIDKPLYHYIQRKRLTLASTFYENSYELQLKSTKARENILRAWSEDENKIQQLISNQHIQAIRFCCSNIFYYRNGMKLGQKYEYINYMLRDKATQERVRFYKSKALKDKVIKYIIQMKLGAILTIIYFINSKKHLDSNGVLNDRKNKKVHTT